MTKLSISRVGWEGASANAMRATNSNINNSTNMRMCICFAKNGQHVQSRGEDSTRLGGVLARYDRSGVPSIVAPISRASLMARSAAGERVRSLSQMA